MHPASNEASLVRELVLLLSDIEGSTPLWDHSAVLMETALPVHDAIVADVVAMHGGRLVQSKGEGDSTFSVFPDVVAATRAGIAIQGRIAAEPWPGGIQIKVRMSVHAGDAIARSGTYFGTTVNRAARLRGLAHGGEIVLSQAVGAVLARAASDIELVDVGTFMLRGLAQPERVQRVILPGLDPGEAHLAMSRVPFPASLALGDVFVGRDGELAQLDAEYEKVRGGGAACVAVTGSAGIGKSRLVAEAAARAYGLGAQIAHATATGGEPREPFTVVTSALDPVAAAQRPAVLEGLEPSRLARLGPAMPALGQRRPDLAGVDRAGLATDRGLFIDSFIELVTAIAADAPLILVVDDVQASGEADLALLGRLAAAAVPGLLLVTTSRLARDAPASTIDRRARFIELGGLEQSAVEALVAATFGAAGAPADGFVEALIAATDANPFLLGEVARTIDPSDPSWARGGLPSSIAEVVGPAIAGLTSAERTVMEIGAVIGSTFSAGVLDRIVAFADDVDVVAALDAAQLRGLVDELGTGSYRFRHDFVRAAVLASINETDLATLHWRVGDALEIVNPPVAPAVLARHFAAALGSAIDDDARKLATRAAEYALVAGRQTLEQFGFHEAAEILAVGIDARGTRHHDEPLDASLALVRSRALRAVGAVEDAKTSAVVAAEIALRVGAASILAEAVVELAEHGTVGVADPVTVRLGEAALAVIGTDEPGLRALVLNALAFHDMLYAGLRERARGRAAEALPLARLSGDDQALATSLSVMGTIELCSPDQKAQLERGRELRRIGIRLGDAVHLQRALRIEACSQLQLGSRPGFEAARGRLTALAERQRSWFWRGLAIQWEVMSYLLDGRLADAEDAANRLLGESAGDVDVVNVYGAQLMLLREQQGRVQEILPLAVAVVDQNPGLVAFRVALAAGYAELGQDDEARRYLAPLVADAAAALPDDVSRVGSLVLLGQAASKVGTSVEVATLATLLAPYEGQLVVLAAGIACLGAADRVRGLLAARAGRWDDAARLLTAAALLEADAPGLRVRTRLGLATVLVAGPGDTETGLALASQVAADATAFGMTGIASAADALRHR